VNLHFSISVVWLIAQLEIIDFPPCEHSLFVRGRIRTPTLTCRDDDGEEDDDDDVVAAVVFDAAVIADVVVFAVLGLGDIGILGGVADVVAVTEDICGVVQIHVHRRLKAHQSHKFSERIFFYNCSLKFLVPSFLVRHLVFSKLGLVLVQQNENTSK
jgi:hypothetical protein